MELAGAIRETGKEPAEQAQLIQGGDLDWQARKALIVEIAAALTGQLIQLAQLRDEPKPLVVAQEVARLVQGAVAANCFHRLTLRGPQD